MNAVMTLGGDSDQIMILYCNFCKHLPVQYRHLMLCAAHTSAKNSRSLSLSSEAVIRALMRCMQG